MKAHDLKIEKKYFDDILHNDKRFEVRLNDRDYKVGDIIHFTIVDDKEDNNDCIFEIVYVLKNIEKYGLDSNYCVFGFRRVIMRYEYEG